MDHILSIVTFVPLVGALALVFTPKDNENAIKWVAFLTTLAGFAVSLPLVFGFDAANTGMQFVQVYDWVGAKDWGFTVGFGLDGLSLWLVMLTTFLTPLCLLDLFVQPCLLFRIAFGAAFRAADFLFQMGHDVGVRAGLRGQIMCRASPRRQIGQGGVQPSPRQFQLPGFPVQRALGIIAAGLLNQMAETAQIGLCAADLGQLGRCQVMLGNSAPVFVFGGGPGRADTRMPFDQLAQPAGRGGRQQKVDGIGLALVQAVQAVPDRVLLGLLLVLSAGQIGTGRVMRGLQRFGRVDLAFHVENRSVKLQCRQVALQLLHHSVCGRFARGDLRFGAVERGQFIEPTRRRGGQIVKGVDLLLQSGQPMGQRQRIADPLERGEFGLCLRRSIARLLPVVQGRVPRCGQP